jgi:hypothetical protein
MAEQFRSMGRTTMERRMPGVYLYVTIEPENVKAILATQFKDFGKGPIVHARWEEVSFPPSGMSLTKVSRGRDLQFRRTSLVYESSLVETAIPETKDLRVGTFRVSHQKASLKDSAQWRDVRYQGSLVSLCPRRVHGVPLRTERKLFG